MSFGGFLRELLKYTLSGALSLGLVAGLLVIVSGAHGDITLDIGLSRWDGVYLILGLPLVLGLLFLLVSPLAYLLIRLLGNRVG